VADENDGLDLREVTINRRQRTILCPNPKCGVEGRNFFLQGSLLPRSILPGKCRECGETFVIHIVDSQEIDLPLRSLAMAIHYASRDWDHKDMSLAQRAREMLDTLVAGTPGLAAAPKFKVARNPAGNVQITPANNEGLRVMEILDEIRDREDPPDAQILKGV
jgi:hypothetical protein